MKIIIAIIIFSILILIHELGHFFLAKKNNVRVVEFSLGFGPRILSFKKGETRYSWKLVPFGGSCAMQGEDEEDKEGEDIEKSFNSKSVWARMSIILAGPIFNFLLALALSVVVTGFAGYDPATVTYVDEGSASYEAGLREGDLITKYNNNNISFGRELTVEEYINPMGEDPVEITYERNGEETTVNIIPDDSKWYAIGLQYYVSEETSAQIDILTVGGPLELAGAMQGDEIVSINGVSLETAQDLYDYFEQNPLSEEKVDLLLQRDGEQIEISVVPVEYTSKTIGIGYNTARIKTTPLNVLKYSFKEMGFEIEIVVKSLGMLFTGQVSTNDISGPVGIVNIIGQTYESTITDGWFVTFISLSILVIMLSSNLGVINLLPIPAVDGGRIIFLIIEAIRGKPISKSKEGMVHFIGMVILMILMVLILFNDIRNL